ncbi:hypothetical protein I3215_30870 [Streptomyces sp. RB110-1]|uniref:hypothetical protein n=1 Tax=unclassified Streptomyces TaxID=2593676 RepID=UPI0019023026|nr:MULTISPECIES: hypothetical protein [unclassified Streptomyces]MBK0377218.1 hypothetical protein [Streptomyces sp. RB110-1]MBK0386410.1 hypothetical protein [Streptomyces sp. RB110-2]
MNEQKFTDMAGQFMRMALDSWRAGNRTFAVLHAGKGCEHVLKALITHCNPLLISDKADRAHRFHALGFGDQPSVKPLTEARTIGITDAFKDATVFMRGTMPVTLQQFTLVMDSRNGIAPFAHHDEQAEETSVSTALRVADAIRTELDVEADDFWGEYETVFTDLAQVATMPVPAGQAGRRVIEAAAEELALAERARTRAMISTAVTTAVEAASWKSATRPDKHQEDVARTALNTALVTALRTAGARVRQTATELLGEYEVVPLPVRPDDSPTDPDTAQRAHTAVTVKVMIASSVMAGLVDVQYLAPHLPIVPSLIELDASGGLRNSQAQDGHAWWRDCPACGYAGNVYGDLDATPCLCGEWEEECQHPGGVIDVGTVDSFSCPFCGLALSNREEIATAGIESRTETPNPAESW